MKVGWADILEAASAPAPDERSWMRSIIDAAPSVFAGDGFLGKIGFIAVEHPPECMSMTTFVESTGWEGNAFSTEQPEVLARFGPEYLRALYYPPSIVTTVSDIGARLPASIGEYIQKYNRGYGTEDALGMIVHPEPGHAVVFCGGYSSRPNPSREQRRFLTRIGLHIESAFRLRRRPEIVKAILRPDGKVVHCEDGAPDVDTLRKHVRSIERARTRAQRTSADGIDLWEALVDGKVSVIERMDGSQRSYFFVENAPPTQPIRSLTSAEIDTVSYAARGLSAKLVGYALGIAETTVSARLASAALKIGVSTRLELVRLAAMLTRDPRARFPDIALTSTERDVLELLAQGLSNSEIAAIRHRSVRTIANQVAQLLRKTKSVNRRALASRS